MNVIQNPAWEYCQYYTTTNNAPGANDLDYFKTAQYNDQQRRIRSGNQTSQWYVYWKLKFLGLQLSIRYSIP